MQGTLAWYGPGRCRWLSQVPPSQHSGAGHHCARGADQLHAGGRTQQLALQWSYHKRTLAASGRRAALLELAHAGRREQRVLSGDDGAWQGKCRRGRVQCKSERLGMNAPCTAQGLENFSSTEQAVPDPRPPGSHYSPGANSKLTAPRSA